MSEHPTKKSNSSSFPTVLNIPAGSDVKNKAIGLLPVASFIGVIVAAGVVLCILIFCCCIYCLAIDEDFDDGYDDKSENQFEWSNLSKALRRARFVISSIGYIMLKSISIL